MTINRFRVGPDAGLQLAEATAVPPLMVIAGSNGAGKSTLLRLLWSGSQMAQHYAGDHERLAVVVEPGTRVPLVGAHRGWDAVHVGREVLWNTQGDGVPLLSSMVQGEASTHGQLLKQRLVQLHVGQRALHDDFLASRGADEQFRRADLPDLFGSFRDLVTSALPHLRFHRVIDHAGSGSVQCLFTTADGSEPFDINQLSSGEKAVLLLLFPLIDTDLLPARDRGPAPTLLIDEFEQHLHPNLQLQAFDYLRREAERGAAQFILTTHSPTVLEILTPSELFVLSPAALRPGENQLARLTTRPERLEAVREVVGSTHAMTRNKPIVFVEGEEPRPGVTSDAALIKRLMPNTVGWSFVPSGPRSRVVEAVRRMQDADLHPTGAAVFGLVDSDRSATTGHERVLAWPVASIENLLLDADAIYNALAEYPGQTRATGVAAVHTALNQAVTAQIDDEIRLRIEAPLRGGYLRARADRLNDIETAARQDADQWVADLRRTHDLPGLEAQARNEVDAIVRAGTALDRFRGKQLLLALFKDLQVDRALTPTGFAFAVARHAARTPRIAVLAEDPIQRIALYFPPGLPDLLHAIDGADELSRACAQERAIWVNPQLTPTGAGRTDLRRQVFEIARTLSDEQREPLAELAGQIGTP